jgi:hypothetical protein
MLLRHCRGSPSVIPAVARRTWISGSAYGREWTTEELMLGMVKDVGDLAMLIQASQSRAGYSLA